MVRPFMKIGKSEIREGRAYIIADVGSNFNDSLDLAKEYIDAGKAIGVDAVKFQTYRAATLLNPSKPDGQHWAAYDVVEKHELPRKWHQELFEHAESIGVEFLTTPFDLEIVAELDRMGMRAFKIASGDLTFAPLLDKIGSFRKPVILSTGSAGVEEIWMSLERLKKVGAREIALLHCVAMYPPGYGQLNLKTIPTMRSIFNLPIGFSDHTMDDVAAIGAIALGASIIEKHITVDKKMGTPDAPFAMTIPQFKEMVRKIRDLEKALGEGSKVPTGEELQERVWMRRGIYARRDLLPGEELGLENVKFVRPLNGLSAFDWASYHGKKIARAVGKDQPITDSDVGA
jgi:N,N'-diacetyllegionaminate synthase